MPVWLLPLLLGAAKSLLASGGVGILTSFAVGQVKRRLSPDLGGPVAVLVQAGLAGLAAGGAQALGLNPMGEGAVAVAALGGGGVTLSSMAFNWAKDREGAVARMIAPDRPGER